MDITLCKYHIVLKSGAELKRRLQSEFEALISRLPGFVGYYLLEVSADQVVSVSIFDSKGKADLASGPLGFWRRHLSSALDDCILGLPEIVSGQTEVYSVCHWPASQSQQLACSVRSTLGRDSVSEPPFKKVPL